MPASIATINGEAAVAYQGETPWHKLGTKMDGMPDVATALKAATLDWKVALEPMFLQSGARVPRRAAVVRDIDSKVLSVVSNDYHIIQNAEAFDVLTPACREFGVTIETAGALGIGDKVWMLAKMPVSVEPVSGDKVDGYALISTGHNGYTPYSARLTPVRVVCANTLSLAMRDEAFVKLNHVRTSGDKMAEVERMVTSLTAALRKTGETFTQLAARKMTKRDIGAYVARVLGIPKLEDAKPQLQETHAAIMQLAEGGRGAEFAPNTAWAAFNAVTEYVDHVRPASAKSQVRLQQANASAVFGSQAKLKVRALAFASKLVN